MAGTNERYTPGSGTAGILQSETRDAGSVPESELIDWGSDRIRSTMPPAAHHTDETYADSEGAACPQCGGEAFELGTLGRTKHHRCRNCGWTFS